MSKKEELIDLIKEEAKKKRASGSEDAVRVDILGIGILYVELDDVEDFCYKFRNISPS